MEIRTETVNRSIITLEFIQDLGEGVDEISPFIRSLEKLKKHIREVGFGNKFTADERGIWENIFDTLLEDDRIKTPQNIEGDRVYVEE